MLGAILGDIIGSPYEFDFRNIKTTDFPLFSVRSEFTDDSVMTLAVAQALMETRGCADEDICAALVKRMQHWGRKYPDAGYGGRFAGWLAQPRPAPYNSFGNGSAMRVSPAGWLYSTLEETLHAAELTARVTHNLPEGIKGAQAVAAAIYMARTGRTKEEIKAFAEQNYGYDLDTTLDEIRPHYHMDETCQGSVPQSFRAFLEGDSYESVVRLAVSIGGDSDTIACIAGSMAEAFYGLPEELKREALDRLDPDLRGIALQFGVFLRLLQPLGPEMAAAWEEEARREKNALALFTLGELYRDGLLAPAEGDAAKKAGDLLQEAYYCLPADGSVEQAPDICMAFVHQRAAVTSRMVLNKATRLAAEGYRRRMLAGEPGAALQLAQVQQLRRKWNLT